MDRERSLTSYCHRQNKLNLGRKWSLIHHQSNQNRTVRKQIQILKHLSPTPPFFPGSASLLFLYLLPPEPHRGTGNGGYGQFMTHCLCRSLSLRGNTPHTLPLLQHEGSSHGRQFSINFSNDSPSHGLQLFINCLSTVLPTGCSPSGTGCSSVGPSRGHQPCQPTGSGVGSSLHGSASPGRSLLQHGLPFITSCKGRVSALTFQAPPPPCFFTDLGVCRVVSFTSSHSSL